MKLYTVTTIWEKKGTLMSKSCLAACVTLDRAKDIIENNEGDIFETVYNLAVIEIIESDTLYSYGKERWWYQWEGDLKTGKYISIECPERYKNVSGFGIG